MSHPSQTHDNCILCGKCLSVCPVFLATGKEELSPRAKHQMLKKLAATPEKLSATNCKVLADRCLSCGRCTKSCPQGASVPHVLAELRAQHSGWQQWVWKRWITQSARLWPLLSSISASLPSQLTEHGPETLQHLTASLRAMTPTSSKNESDKTTARQDESSLAESAQNQTSSEWLQIVTWDTTSSQKRPVMLFSGCTARRTQRQWQQKATHILESLGYTVLSETTDMCCGLTLDHAGIPEAVTTCQQKNIEAWRKAGRPLLVTFCASCQHGLQNYTHTFSGWHTSSATQHQDTEQARFHSETDATESSLWKNSIVPLSSLWGKTTFRLTQKAPFSCHYHSPCHWQGQDSDKQWLNQIFRNESRNLLSPSSPTCCGMGGILQLTDLQLSHSISSHCWDAYKAATGDTLITGCSGCIIQLRATAPPKVHVTHWLDILSL